MTSRPNAEYILPEITWAPDSQKVAVMTLNRAQNELMLLAWPYGVGDEPRSVLLDKDPAWVNVYGGPHFLPHADKIKDPTDVPQNGFGAPFIWLSERDGWLHAYLYKSDGTLERQITQGPWMITPNGAHSENAQPVEIDPSGEWLYFAATEKDPRERQTYRIRLDGSIKAPERLTREDGTHSQHLSSDGQFLLENFSSVDHPPVARVLKSDGAKIATLYQSAGYKPRTLSEFQDVVAADGTKLYGRIMKPLNFDAAKKYPLIVDVYGGPSIQIVKNTWGADDWLDSRLVAEGFIVWKMDNRGSFGRGHAWETAIFKHMGAKELEDQIAGVDFLKKLPYIDSARIGIRGWSYGGYMTLYALTHAPNVFKCGMAGAPVTDWKFYDTIYTERYMRTPADNPDGYLSSSPLHAASNLSAKVLIVHGTSDDNVHMQNTMAFVDALTRAGRPYELQIQPGQKHGFSGEGAWQYLTDRMIEFFKRNL